MTDLHAQLEAWLADGALGDPPREIAVHASVCEQCTATLGAFDALALIDVGAAGSPPPLTAPSRLRVGMAWARVGTAVTATVLAGILVVFGLSQLVGFGTPASGPAAEPEGTELAGLSIASDGAAQSSEPSADDSTPGEATTPGIATPLPGVTPGPQPPPPPGATPRPPTPSATAAPTAPPTTTPAPTSEPTPTPLPECTDGADNDSDGYFDLDDPACLGDPSHDTESPFNFHECNNSIDDDGDHLVDFGEDPGCSNEFDDTESPQDLIYQCNDGLDNELILPDGLIDFGNDPQCESWTDNDETL